MKNILIDLNSKQKEAATTIKGPILIIAGAGSGKTKTLTCRLAYLISKGVSPQNILAVTFTNKAAEEMRERIRSICDIRDQINKHSRLFIGTFHAFGVKILRQEIEKINLIRPGLKKTSYQKNFVIFDEDDQLSLIKNIIKDFGINPKQFNPLAVLCAISRAKSELKTPEDFNEDAEGFFKQNTAKIYFEYQERLKKNNALDFDDILMKTIEIFRNFPEILEKYQEKFKYILVDEYQDTNFAQYTLINLLAKKHRNLCVVGDDFQSIYSWRGADFRNILNFEKDYPDAKIVMLEENYRSTQNILNAANAVIEKNIFRTEKKLWTKNPDGNLLHLYLLNNEKDEAEFVAKTIKNLSEKNKLPLTSFAVLYRTNAQSRVIEEAFLNMGIPYKLVGAVKFYSRKEIKDIIAYLRLIQNPNDQLSLERIINIPPRGIGKTLKKKFLAQKIISPKITSFLNLMKKLRNETKKSQNLTKLIQSVIKKTGYEEYLKNGTIEDEARLENIRELLSVSQKYSHLNPEKALILFLEEIALISDADEIENKKNLVNLMTLHSAKGLEFSVVFIVGLEEGLLPHSQSILDPNQLEEERRLCYVGITRAKKELYLTLVRRRLLFSSTQTSVPSRFLSEIPEHLINFVSDYEPSIEI